MISFIIRMIGRRNRPSKYREADQLGKRSIPHSETGESPKGLQQLERYGNQENSPLAEDSKGLIVGESEWRKKRISVATAKNGTARPTGEGKREKTFEPPISIFWDGWDGR